MKKKWEFYDTDEELVQKLSQELKVSNILITILMNRKIIHQLYYKRYLSIHNFQGLYAVIHK